MTRAPGKGTPPAIAALVLLALGATADAADDLQRRANALFRPIPTDPAVVNASIRNNPVTPEKIDLGAMLFFDPRLSRSHVISCNTCHNVGMGGGDNVPTSIGHGWQHGPRNSPTVLNAVFNLAQFWDGRAEDLKAQAKSPVQASVEMNNTPDRVVATLNSIPEYVQSFREAFPDEADPVSFDNMARAIEAFETTLITPNARFDRFLLGDLEALDTREQNGLRLFMDKGCASCHNGINVGGNGYFGFGVVQRPGAEILPPGDKGRFEMTRTASDEYVFRAGPLRNIALTAPYFHSGAVWSLREAVTIMGSSQLGIRLNDQEIDDITAFLRTLTGEPPRVVYPILPPSTTNTPRPER